MTLINQELPKRVRPIGRAIADFEPISSKEQHLLSESRKSASTLVWQDRPEQPDAVNTVRAEFLRFLALGGDDFAPVHERGVELSCAWITGSLNLEGAKIDSTIKFVNCHFAEVPIFRDATVRGSVMFFDCTLPGLGADRLSCTGGFYFNQSTAVGEVRLLGSRLGSDLDLSESTVERLSVDGATINGNVCLNRRFRSTDSIRFVGTKINGTLNFNSASIVGNGGPALTADAIVISGGAHFEQGFTAVGSIVLTGAEIGGSVNGNGMQLDGAGDAALVADGISIRGNLLMREISAIGEIRILGSRILGDVNFRGSNLKNEHGKSLSADRALVGGDFSLSGQFVALGQLRLPAAQISGALDLRGASLAAHDEYALLADRANIKGGVDFCDLKADGGVRVSSVAIEGNLVCENASFKRKQGGAFLAEGLCVAGSFVFRKLSHPISGVNLTSARLGILIDDEVSWGENLTLDGLRYAAITGGASTEAHSRLTWLDKQRTTHSGKDGDGGEFKPQPWRQLQHVMREMGHFEDARQVAVAFEHRRRHAGLVGQSPKGRSKTSSNLNRMVSRLAHWAFGVLVCYGYRPVRLVGWMIIVWLACAAFYWYAAIDGVFAPSDPLVFQNPSYAACAFDTANGISPPSGNMKVAAHSNRGNWYLCSLVPEEYTGLSPLAYSLDVILPFVNLQQEQDWAPMIPTPTKAWHAELANFSLKHIVRLVVWFEIIFGWVAGLLLVAVVSGLTKRAED